MASQSSSGGVQDQSTSDEKYERLIRDHRDLVKYECTSKIVVALDDMSVKIEDILYLLQENALSDFWIPMSRNSFPRRLSPSQYPRFSTIQSQLLVGEFIVGNKRPCGHLSLSDNAIHKNTLLPKTLQYIEDIGDNNQTNLTDVTEVKYGSETFALKRIKRNTGGNHVEESAQMHYINGELRILRKLRPTRIRHFIELVGSYTDSQYIGMLLSPKADCNLAGFLDNFRESYHIRLQRFFGCLATALAYLHYVQKVRHKDIKPQNILIKDNNVLLTDFGISLDWSPTNRTTTQKEKFKSGIYCAPEVDNEGQPRNSKSDIWSLGCVFMEMFVVLKGKKRGHVSDTLQRYGSPRFCKSPRGIEDLIVELRADSSQDNVPLDWIERMLQHAVEKRPHAVDLRDEILLIESYCGICCQSHRIFENEASSQSNEDRKDDDRIVSSLDIKVYLPGNSCVWSDVEAFTDTSLSKCWVSPSVVNKSNVRRKDSEIPESAVFYGKEYGSSQCTTLSCKIGNALRTSIIEFCIAEEEMPVKMVVTKDTYEDLRQVGTFRNS